MTNIKIAQKYSSDVLFFNNINKIDKLNFKKQKPHQYFVQLKLLVIGNFFRLRYKKKFILIKFDFRLAHKVYFIKRSKRCLFFVKKVKKNKIVLNIQKYYTQLCGVYQSIHKLQKFRGLNTYTKKGVKRVFCRFQKRKGKKSTYT